jgi:predicted  nucleic acid-binding Zn-ribbon protein
MTDNTFTALISLVQYDQETSRLEGDVQQIEGSLHKIDIQEEQVKSELATAQELVSTMRKQVNNKELEIKIIEDNAAIIRDKLDRAKNEKEYGAIKLELESFEEKQTQGESNLVRVWHQFEQAQQALEKKKQSTEVEREALQEQREQKEKELARKRQDINARMSESQKKQTLVPPHWLDIYLRMSNRVSDPVVPVQQGSCSVCFHLISNEDMNVLDKQELVQCKGCYRLLYIPTPVDAA